MLSIYTFFKQTLENFYTTGAIAPSSSTLAKNITSIVARKVEPVKVLEVGAGTGVLTKKLLQILGEEDHIDICEINPNFVSYLEKRFKEDKIFKNYKGSYKILPIDVQQLEGENVYDFIISSLPFNAFQPQMVENILNVYLKLVKPWGWISYFEYIGIRNIKMIISGKKEKERLHKVGKVLKHFIRHHEIFHQPIWWNLPPAYVRHCQKKVK